MRRASLAVVLLAACLGLAACETKYDERNFELVAYDTAWGSMFAKLFPAGKSKEGDVDVYASPYRLVFAPRLKTAPAADCRLTITDLSLTPLSGGRPMLSGQTVALTAKPPNPREPNQREYSPHFTYIPVERAYLAQGDVKHLQLRYTPYRLVFELRGGPTCPEGLRDPVHVDAVFQQRRMTGSSTWWDVIGGV